MSSTGTGGSPPRSASPASVTDGQLAAWMAEEYGKNFTAPVEDLLDLDVEEVLTGAACVLDDHRAAHPLRAMAIWPDPCPGEMLITADRPGEGRLCVLAVSRRSFGVSMQQALDELLRAARTAAALLDAAGQDSTPPPGRHVPESGTVLTYDAGTVAEGSLDEAVHELFSRRASAVNNAGPLAQMAYLIGELGPAGRTAGDHPGHAGQALSSLAAGAGNLLTRPRAPGAGFLSRSTITVTSGACGPAALRRAGRPWLSPGRRAACHRRRKRAAGDRLRSPGLQGSPPVPCASTEA